MSNTISRAKAIEGRGLPHGCPIDYEQEPTKERSRQEVDVVCRFTVIHPGEQRGVVSMAARLESVIYNALKDEVTFKYDPALGHPLAFKVDVVRAQWKEAGEA